MRVVEKKNVKKVYFIHLPASLLYLFINIITIIIYLSSSSCHHVVLKEVWQRKTHLFDDVLV